MFIEEVASMSYASDVEHTHTHIVTTFNVQSQSILSGCWCSSHLPFIPPLANCIQIQIAASKWLLNNSDYVADEYPVQAIPDAIVRTNELS